MLKLTDEGAGFCCRLNRVIDDLKMNATNILGELWIVTRGPGGEPRGAEVELVREFAHVNEQTADQVA